jgi:citrate synthase
MEAEMSPERQARDELSASEAAKYLNVELPTLYAYVSRGLLRSLAPAGGSRARRYLRSDVEGLRARQRGGAAARALAWGEPVLDSAITAMTARGPAYRGRIAVDLAKRGVSFEAASELLWTGVLPAADLRWEAASDPPDFRAVARLLPKDASRTSAAIALVATAGVRDRHRYDKRLEAVLPRARRLARLLACSLALPASATRAAEAWRESSIARAVLRACGVRATPRSELAVDRWLLLCADHELNASTFATRVAASTDADLYAAALAGLAAFSGPLHGAASDRAEALVAEIPRPEDAERVVRERGRRGERTPGFGHPFYREGDPRALVVLEEAWTLAPRSREVKIVNAIIRAMELAQRPKPNVDIGIVALRAALALPVGAASGIFAVGRSAGWSAHVLEQYATAQLLRPRARYMGAPPEDAALLASE